MWIAKLFYSCVHRTHCVWIVFNGHKSTLKKASWSSSTQRTYRSFHRPIFVKFTREPNNFCCWRCCCLVVVFSVTVNTCFCVLSHCGHLSFVFLVTLDTDVENWVATELISSRKSHNQRWAQKDPESVTCSFQDQQCILFTPEANTSSAVLESPTCLSPSTSPYVLSVNLCCYN